MLKKRKAQGLPITTIILVVIGLIVLVVLIAIFTGRLGDFSTGVKGSATCDQVCKAAGYTSGALTGSGTQTGGMIDSGGNKCTCT